MKKVTILQSLFIFLLGCISQPVGSNKMDSVPSEIYSAQVPNGKIVLWESYNIPQLKRSRTIRIYLPPGYDKTSDHYPFMYMMVSGGYNSILVIE